MFLKKIKSTLTFAIAISTLAATGQEIEKPNISSKTSFAIVVDSKTYDAAKDEIAAYKKLVEKDGLGTYIIYANWESPDKIREILKDLYQNKKSPLEGTVLIGDIPIPMLRDAQFMTSALKINQNIRWDKSSVPSDRFYDDFDLQFDYLKQDTAASRRLLHYYSLKAESPQYLEMDIYSARIKPPVAAGEDKIQKIKDYLKRLVALRSKEYPLDDMIASYGHGYNSNAVNSITGEALALKAQMPQLFKPGGSVKFLNFRNADFMKFNLLSELKRNDIDFAYMTGHGTATLQLLNGYPYVSSPQPSMENVGRYLRSKVRNAKEDGRDVQKTIDGFKTSLGVSDKWFADVFDPKSIEADSIYNINLDVQMDDLKDAGIKSKVVYLNSCLTGSFQLDNYIAGYYPFSNNENIAAIANSVGVLQDLWPTEMMGLLTNGYRIGNWLKHIAYLETHIHGDPTFHYASARAKELNEATTLNKSASYWKKVLQENDADLQSLALNKLTNILPEKEVSPLLKEYYFNSAFEPTRMQAFQLLRRFENKEYQEVLHAAKGDSYEYIRRRAIYDLTDYGSDDFSKDLIEFYINDPHSERIAYRARWALQFMNPDLAKQHVNELIRNNPAIAGREELANKLDKDLDYYKSKSEELLKALQNPELSEKEKISEIKSLRLYRHHRVVPAVIDLAKDNKNSDNVRTNALEALGWFTLSYQREAIVEGCESIIASDAPAAVKKEALKTKNRIHAASHKI